MPKAVQLVRPEPSKTRPAAAHLQRLLVLPKYNVFGLFILLQPGRFEVRLPARHILMIFRVII